MQSSLSEIVGISSLKFDPKNVRKHSKKNLTAIKNSLKRFGQQKPIVVSIDDIVLAGNGTLEAARALGWSDIEIKRTKLTGDEAIAYALADNRTGDLSEWNEEALGEMLILLDKNKFELEDIGFSNRDLLKYLPKVSEAGLTAADEIPEKMEKRCEIGDVWAMGKHRLICGDSTEVTTVEKLMNGEFADMVWTDPPYNVAYVGKTADALTIKNDKMDDGEFTLFLRDAFTGMMTFMRKGSSFYIAHADTYGLNFRQAVKQSGLTLKQCLIWVKNSMVMGRQDYHWQHEPILYGWLEGVSHSWYTDRKQTTVLSFNRPTRSTEHPTMKPVDLIEYMIGNSSKEGNIVLDIFLGSGSTLIACEKTKRVCYGVELDPHYCDVILTRWERFTGLKASRI